MNMALIASEGAIHVTDSELLLHDQFGGALIDVNVVRVGSRSGA